MPDRSRIDELRRRLDAEPDSIIFAALAEEYRRAEMYQEAVDTCRAGLAQHPMYLSAGVTLGRALTALGEFSEAREALTDVINAAPNNVAAIHALADLYASEGKQGSRQTHPAIESSRAPELTEPSIAPHPPPSLVPVPTPVVSAPDLAPTPAVELWQPAVPEKAEEEAEAPPPPAVSALERFLRGVQAVRRARVGNQPT